MGFNNLIYMSFINIKQRKIIVSFPDPEPEIYGKIIDEVGNRVFESFDTSRIGVGDIEIEGISVFFLSDDSQETAAFLITIGEYYPRRFANNLLNELVKLVLTNGYKRNKICEGLQEQIEPELIQLFQKYDTVIETDAATLIKAKTEYAMDNIEESLQHVMDSIGNVELLRESSMLLTDKSQTMFQSAKKANRFFSNKTLMIIGITVGSGLVVAGIIGLIIYYSI